MSGERIEQPRIERPSIEQPRIEQRGLWFEEFAVGTVYVHRPGRTLTEADNVLFTTLTMNSQALHLDAAFAATQPGFGGQRLINSMLTLSTLVGLSVSQLTQGTLVANLGFSEIAFPKPLFAGDTIYAETECLSVRPASKPGPDGRGRGVVELLHRALNQDGVEVARARRATLMWCAP